MVTYYWQVLTESFLSQPHPGEAKGEPGSVMTQEQKEVLSHPCWEQEVVITRTSTTKA